MEENEQLKKANEKLDSTYKQYHSRDFNNMSAIQQLEQRCLRYEKAVICYSGGSHCTVLPAAQATKNSQRNKLLIREG